MQEWNKPFCNGSRQETKNQTGGIPNESKNAWLRLFDSGNLCGAAGPTKDKDKDEVNRIENAGTVVEEILNVPDDIRRSADKARRVVVLPSVSKPRL
jgi:hypothetical protein